MQEVFEKIIERMRERRNNVLKQDIDYAEGLRDAYKNAIEIVKQEAEEYNNSWIPCSERMPDSSCDVIITTHSLVNGVGSYFGEDSGWIQWFSGGGIAVDVIAWQPLPAPYRPNICINNDCTFNKGQDCPAAEGCGGYERKRTNFDMCCESMEAMAQIIDIAKIGWTKEQIIEWLQKEECEVPE